MNILNILNEKQMRVVIVGATGMVGGYALRYMLEHKSVERVTAIGRRELGISHAKLKEVLHGDFENFSALAEALSGQNAAIFCLGAYTGAGVGRGTPQDNGRLHSRVCASSTGRKPRRGVLILERKWRGEG